MRLATAPLSGWGNYPVQNTGVYRPEKLQQVEVLVRQAALTLIGRGLGRSYGDTALNEGGSVVLTTRLNRMLEFDPATGVLRCEAGVSLEEILNHFLPRGFFLPVTPGTKYVSLGGAIACDVHGKNHHRDGSIIDHVLSFRLLTGTGEVITCSREENAEVFWATAGGIGLTGMILEVVLRLLPVGSSWLEVDYRKAANLEQALEMLQSTEADYQYSVAWIDCLATGRSMGRSVLILGNHIGHAPNGRGTYEVTHKGKLSVPFHPPRGLLNRLTVAAFNAAYYHGHRDSRKTVSYDSFFYPLDSIAHWNRLYGRDGFVQFQVAFPPETSADGLEAVLKAFSVAGLVSFLAVLKTFGEGNPGPLSFPMKGYTLALDIPMSGQRVLDTINQVTRDVLRYGGRYYLAKDAVMDAGTFRAMYPRLPEFQAVQRRLDPRGVFSSSMARRLGIVEVL